MPNCHICDDDRLPCNYCAKDRDGKAYLASGAVYIAARLIDMFDQPTMAIESLKTAGFTTEDFAQAAESDLEIIRPYFSGLPKGK